MEKQTNKTIKKLLIENSKDYSHVSPIKLCELNSRKNN